MRTEITKDSFNNQSFYVGIDYHKKSWQVTILGVTQNIKYQQYNLSKTLVLSCLNFLMIFINGIKY